MSSSSMRVSPQLAAARRVRLVRVIDGDTVAVADTSGAPLHVRLRYIDAPESRQLDGTAASEALRALIGPAGAPLLLHAAGTDRYGRTLGTLATPAGVDVNLEMVARGWAWAFVRYGVPPAYVEAERAARERRLGVFRNAAAVEPWTWRATRRQRSAARRAHRNTVSAAVETAH